jgi:4-diphosphocytidyl-2-C-methyl-D-erythritol kinase
MATDSTSLLGRAPAKINLFLHVGDKRADGYHALRSLTVFVDVADTLRVREADTLSLAIEGPHGAGLSAGDDNLVLRAARALDARRGAHIVLHKVLPVASGIGGGSADAAAALRGLRRFWTLDVSDEALLEIAATLGSDVPVCVRSRAAWMEGRGEILTPAPRLGLSLVLANPNVAVSTAQVFRALDRRSGTAMTPPPAFDDFDDLLAFLQSTRNDLEAPARALQPAIGEVLERLAALPGARLARMSGSGATCFALFDDDDLAQEAGIALARERRDWWVSDCRTCPPMIAD